MDITYRRDYNKNYMVIKSDNKIELAENNYQLKMLEENKIQGLLETNITYVNSCPNMSYNITSKMNIIDRYSRTGINFDAIKSFQWGLSILMKYIESHLLNMDHVLLNPQYIFLDAETLLPQFCYFPFSQNDFYHNIKELYQEIIKSIDYQDKRAVQMAYGLEQLSIENDLTAISIQKLLQKCTSIDELPNRGREDNIVSSSYEKEWAKPKDDMIRESSGDKKSKLKFYHVFDKFKIGNKIRENRQKGALENIVLEEPDSILYGELSNDETNLLHIPSDYKMLLICMNPDFENIGIKYFPCVIGKQQGMADYIVPCKTVSRIHFKLIEEGSKIYVQDLNSTNGTLMNNQSLMPYEKVELKNSDSIIVGEIKYKVEIWD